MLWSTIQGVRHREGLDVPVPWDDISAVGRACAIEGTARILSELAKMPCELPTYREISDAFNGKAGESHGGLSAIEGMYESRIAPLLVAKDAELKRLTEWSERDQLRIAELERTVAGIPNLEGTIKNLSDNCARFERERDEARAKLAAQPTSEESQRYTADELDFIDKAIIASLGGACADSLTNTSEAEYAACVALDALSERRKIRGAAVVIDEAGAKRLAKLDSFYAGAYLLAGFLDAPNPDLSWLVYDTLEKHRKLMLDRGAELTNARLEAENLRGRLGNEQRTWTTYSREVNEALQRAGVPVVVDGKELSAPERIAWLKADGDDTLERLEASSRENAAEIAELEKRLAESDAVKALRGVRNGIALDPNAFEVESPNPPAVAIPIDVVFEHINNELAKLDPKDGTG